MTNTRGWKALELARRALYFWRRVPEHTPASPTEPPTILEVPALESPVGAQHQGDILHRVAKLESQLALVEKHHVTGFWYTLDRIDDLVAPASKPKCIVCGHHAPRNEYEVLTSKCLFNGGRLERYRCPTCDCIFGSQKFLDLDDVMVEFDYQLLYSRYREGDASKTSELRAFRALDAKPRGVYLNWGAGAWNDTTQKLRNEGCDVWSFEPSAPANSDYLITDRSKIMPNVAGIFSNNVIEHFRKPIEEFENFHKLLAPGARMAHASPCYDYLYPFTRFHTVFLLGRSPEVLAARTGFKIIDRIDDGEFHCVVFEKIQRQNA